MNTKIVIGVLILLALLGIGGWLYFKKTPQKVAETQATESSQPSTMTSLRALLTAGVSQKCTFEMGTMVISGGKFKGDINTTVDGKTTQMHMLNDGQYSFIWGGDLPQGIKIKIDAQDSGTSDNSKYFDENAQANYKCEPTVTTEADFVAPTDVKFMDLPTTQLMMPKTAAAGY